MLNVIFHLVVALDAGLLGKISIDFAFRDVNFFVYFTFTQALCGDFIPNFITEGGTVDTLSSQTLTKFLDG